MVWRTLYLLLFETEAFFSCCKPSLFLMKMVPVFLYLETMSLAVESFIPKTFAASATGKLYYSTKEIS